MIRNYFVKSSEFTKNTLTLVLGTAVAQSIPFLLHPFLRRIYSPEDFGAISVYLSLLAIISIVSALRYEAAVVLPKEDQDGANVFMLSVVINLIVALIGWVVLFLFRTEISGWINFPLQYSSYLLLLPLAALVFSVYQSMNYWLIRRKAFAASTRNKIVRRGVEGGVQLSLGLLQVPGGLFIGDLLGNVANVIAGWRQMLRNAFSTTWISKTSMKQMAAHYKEFPLYNVLPTLLSSLATTLPFLFINKFFSTETVGYLDLTRLVLSIPLVFIAATISQVLFQQITVKKNESLPMSGDLKRVLILLTAIIGLEFLVILPFGPALFSLVFGDNYALSGQYARILIFSFSLNFISSTFSCVFISLKKIRLNAIWQVLYFTGICSLSFFRDVDILHFLKIFVLIDASFQVLNCGMIYYIVRQYDRQLSSEHVSR